MSEFDFGFGSAMGDVDVDRGQRIIEQFHNAMKARYGSKYDLSLGDLLSKYKTGILEGIGLAANAAGMSDTKTQLAMNTLADTGQGKIPATWNGYISALQGQASKISWIDAASYTITSSASDIAQTAVEAGTVLKETGGAVLNVSKLLPYLIYGATGLLLYGLYQSRSQISERLTNKALDKVGL